MLYDFTVQNSSGAEVSLRQYEGKVLLIINTATGCGLTPQYQGLQQLYDQYKNKGLEILDFPCNQFLGQAPGTDEEISQFCTSHYQTTFPRFAKIEVNGENASPLYQYLKKEQPKDIEDEQTPAFQLKLKELKQEFPEPEIKWNFTKFLVDRKGDVVARFAPTCTPEMLKQEVAELL